jgi:predicted dehydrogenase
MKKINLVFIGAGFITQICHLPNFANNKKVKIQAICDPDYKLAKKIGKRYSINKIYKNHSDLLLNEKKIDAAVLSVPRHKTSSIAFDILEKGINLFSEKPMAQSLQAAKRLVEISQKKKLKYVLGHMKRFDESVIFLKKLFNSKEFNLNSLISVYYKSFAGDSFGHFRKFINKNKTYKPHSLSNEAFNNNILRNNRILYLKFLNTHSHAINLLRYLIGELKIEKKNIDKNGEGLVYFKKKNKDIILSTRFLYSNTWHEEVEFIFKNFKIVLTFPMPLLINQPGRVVITNFENSKKNIISLKLNWSFANQAKAFIDYLTINKKNPCTAKNCLDDLKIIEKIFC